MGSPRTIRFTAWWATLVTAPLAWGHGLPLDVTVREGQVRPFELDGRPIFDMGEFTQPAGTPLLLSDNPGFGVTNRANGVVVGETLGFDVTSHLVYWDGSEVSGTDAELMLVSPSGDSQYAVRADSSPQSGLELGTYDGRRFWDAHGLFTLTPETAEPGLYGVRIRLTSSLHEPSGNFLLPFVYDPLMQWEAEELHAARLLLEQTFAGPLGDLNADGLASLSDLDLLCSQVGQSSADLRFDLDADGSVAEGDVQWWHDAHQVLVGDSNLDGQVGFEDFLALSNYFGRPPADIAGWSAGDFNCDQAVNFTDFLLLANHFGERAAASVPEPSAHHLLVLTLAFLTAGRRRKRAFVESNHGE